MAQIHMCSQNHTLLCSCDWTWWTLRKRQRKFSMVKKNNHVLIVDLKFGWLSGSGLFKLDPLSIPRISNPGPSHISMARSTRWNLVRLADNQNSTIMKLPPLPLVAAKFIDPLFQVTQVRHVLGTTLLWIYPILDESINDRLDKGWWIDLCLTWKTLNQMLMTFGAVAKLLQTHTNCITCSCKQGWLAAELAVEVEAKTAQVRFDQ